MKESSFDYSALADTGSWAHLDRWLTMIWANKRDKMSPCQKKALQHVFQMMLQALSGYADLEEWKGFDADLRKLKASRDILETGEHVFQIVKRAYDMRDNRGAQRLRARKTDPSTPPQSTRGTQRGGPARMEGGAIQYLRGAITPAPRKAIMSSKMMQTRYRAIIPQIAADLRRNFDANGSEEDEEEEEEEDSKADVAGRVHTVAMRCIHCGKEK